MPPPRDAYSTTLTYVDTSGVLKPLNNAQVTVYFAGTVNKATIYASRDPNNATQVTNPFVTGATGLAEFYAEAGEYDVVQADLNAPARTANKTVSWNASPMAIGSIPGDRILADAGVPYGALSAVAVRQDVPIGGIIDWWRPAASVPVPEGWVVCDGQLVLAANHQFPGITSNINVPDLRNKFVLGASETATYGAAGGGADGTASAPGIGGLTGSHQVTLTTAQLPVHTHTASQAAHSHTATQGGHSHAASQSAHTHGTTQAAHSHTATQPAHSHGASQPAHSHGVNDPGHVHETPTDAYYSGVAGVLAQPGSAFGLTENRIGPSLSAQSDISIQSAQPAITINNSQPAITIDTVQPLITVASVAPTITVDTVAPAITVSSTTPSITVDNTGSGSFHTNIPHSVGLLKIMKVRRA